MMTDSSSEEHSAGFPADVPDGVSCKHGLKLQDHLHIKKEEEELWESLEVKQETDITAVTVKSEDEEEEAQCSLLHWRQSEENIKGEPASSPLMFLKVEPNGDMSEGPEATNTDGEETDCSEDWREPLSQSEDQSQHMDMSSENFQTSENNIKGTAHNTQERYGCDVCGERFIYNCILKRHMRMHTGEKPFGCDVCGERFKYNNVLKRHMRLHTGEKPFGCDVCQKRFITRGEMINHMTIHTGEKPFACDICGKRFHSRKPLKRHKIIHTGEKPFTCDICGKQTRFKFDLKRHMGIHTGEKPYVCDICGKQFPLITNLKIHMRIHTGEKPYECDVLTTKSEVINQMRIQTGKNCFRCDVCGKEFNRKFNLNRHMLIHT